MFQIFQIFLTAIATFVFLMVGAFVFVVAMGMLLIMAIWQKVTILSGNKTADYSWKAGESEQAPHITIIDVDYKEVKSDTPKH